MARKLWVFGQPGGGQQDFLQFIKCGHCGLVIDQTTYEMSQEERSAYITKIHSAYLGQDENVDDPGWIERLDKQVLLLIQMFGNGIFNKNMRIADYGCGDGKLSEYFRRYYESTVNGNTLNEENPVILKYDKFMRPEGDSTYLLDSEMKPGSFDAIVTCSVFEHLIGKRDIDEVLGLLNNNGILCLHTLVCEEVPCDPDWYYLLPDHVTLWTNKAMDYLYKDYGYSGCAYNIEARMWFFFKDKTQFDKLYANKDKITGTWVFSNNFVDYWKKKPYRQSVFEN